MLSPAEAKTSAVSSDIPCVAAIPLTSAVSHGAPVMPVDLESPRAMRLGMMQPYFFPYVGYFSLIHATDHWVIFDTAQYMRRAWVNRNRVLSDGAEPWDYVRVPVLHAPRDTAIRDTIIDPKQNWIEQMFAQLDVYRLRRAPHFKLVMEWLRSVLTDCSQRSAGRLSSLLISLLQATCEFLNLPFRFQIFSQMQIELPTIMSPGDWAFETSRQLGAATYINAPGGRDLFDDSKFRRAGIQLRFLQPQLQPYCQGRTPFVAGLSILDLLMWNSSSEVLNLIRQYSLAETQTECDLAA